MPNCKNCRNNFQITPTDQELYKRFEVPEPQNCAYCRQVRRMSWRNDQNYYKNTCYLCKKSVVSIYSPDKKFKILCSKCFWSDDWNPLENGKEYDFNKPFFEQYKNMRDATPRLALFNTQSENSEYTVHSSKNKNCYMSSSLNTDEDILYSDFILNSKDCIDMMFCDKMENCYECSDSQLCYNSDFLELCTSLVDSFMAFDCKGCTSVVGCVSLKNKANYILNQPATHEEVVNTILKLKQDSEYFKEFSEKYKQLNLQVPKRDSWQNNTENCWGNNIVNSKNASIAFNVKDAEDVKYVFDVMYVKDCIDIYRVGSGEFTYEVNGIVDLKYSKFCNLTYQSSFLQYCDNSHNSKNCFGCVSLKSNEYCILNKQYSRAEYETMLPKIIEHTKSTGEYGEFFPMDLSPFAYNETRAIEVAPLNKEQVEAKGLQWSDYENPTDNQTASDVIRICEVTGKSFRLVKYEIEFYKRKGLPLPNISPAQRHLNRTKKQNPRVLYNRKCQKCETAIQTTYAPDKPEIIYCEKCYLKTVY